MNKIIFHIDVNSAFLSWSAVDMLKKGHKTDVREIPSVVGGSEASRQGIVLASSIPAKKFGIKTGEPLYKAREKCPDLVCIAPDFEAYENFSKEFFKICNNYSPALEQFSIDELFLDYTGMEYFFGTPLEGANKISNEIKAKLGFTVNIGISENKLLAKMASDFEKPDKIHTLFKDEIKTKMWPLPVNDLLMVGRNTYKKLTSLGIFTIKQLALTDENILKYHFKSFGTLLKNYANGNDCSVINTEIPPPKSISNGFTIPHDIFLKEEAYNYALSLCEKTGMRLRKHNFSASLFAVTLKYSDFSYTSRQKKINEFIYATGDIFKVIKSLIDEIREEKPIRAITITLSDFGSMENIQSSFFSDVRCEKHEHIDEAIDKMRKKYGYYCVTRASLLNNDMNQKITKMQNANMKSAL